MDKAIAQGFALAQARGLIVLSPELAETIRLATTDDPGFARRLALILSRFDL
jgi:hypothetical protein